MHTRARIAGQLTEEELEWHRRETFHSLQMQEEKLLKDLKEGSKSDIFHYIVYLKQTV